MSPWVNAAVLAENLSVSVPTVHRWAKLGKIPRGKRVNGGVRLWQWAEVERYLGVKSGSSAIDWDKRIDNATL